MQKHSPKHALYGGNCLHFYFCFILKIITSFGFHAERQKNNNQIWMRIKTFFVNFVDKAKIRLIVICAFRRHVYVYAFCSLSATIQQFTHLHFNCHCLCKWVILGQVTYFCYRFHGIERDWIARTKQKKVNFKLKLKQTLLRPTVWRTINGYTQVNSTVQYNLE